MTPASLPVDPTLSILEAQVSLLGQDPSKLTTMLGTDPNHLNPQRDQLQGIFGVPFHKKANGDRFSSRDYVMETINEVNINGSRKHPLTLLENALATRVLFSNATTWSFWLAYCRREYLPSSPWCVSYCCNLYDQ